MENNATAPHAQQRDAEDEHITPTEAMAKLRYVDRKSFWRMAKLKAMPMRRLNARVILIPRQKFHIWLEEFDAA